MKEKLKLKNLIYDYSNEVFNQIIKFFIKKFKF
jgi:hypothetical protein